MKLRFAAAIIAVAAVACGGSSKTNGKTPLDAQGRPLPVATGDEGRGVSITGEHAYDDRHDPSGWSGKTKLPGAVGGGPQPNSEATPAAAPSASAGASLPSATPSAAPSATPSATAIPAAKPAPSASASSLPPSKELDTAPPPPPSKELQF